MGLLLSLRCDGTQEQSGHSRSRTARRSGRAISGQLLGRGRCQIASNPAGILLAPMLRRVRQSQRQRSTSSLFSSPPLRGGMRLTRRGFPPTIATILTRRGQWRCHCLPTGRAGTEERRKRSCSTGLLLHRLPRHPLLQHQHPRRCHRDMRRRRHRGRWRD
jgi:hypothetical protein